MIPGLKRSALWLWSAPGNLVGILLLILLSPCISRVRSPGQGYEVILTGRLSRWFLARGWGGFTASGLVTFLWEQPYPYISRHEQAHRKQATYLSVFWLPVYLGILAGLALWYRSASRAYQAHPFERWAREAESEGGDSQD